MKVLVTGAAGFVGSVLTGALLDASHEVVALDDLSCGVASLVGYASRRGFTFIHGDVRSTEDLDPAIRGVDAIMHLAAIVGMPACDRAPALAKAVNVDATRLLMRLRTPDQRVVFPNTNSGYGTAQGTVCTEETPLAPISIYGRQKAEAERIVLDAPNTVSLRLATVFGMSPRMRRDLLVNDFAWRGLKDRRIDVYEGHAMRNYVHVRDVARAFVWIVDASMGRRQEIPSGVYNFGNDAINLSKRALAERMLEHMAAVVVNVAGADPDKRNYVVSSAKLAKAGIVATIGLDEGIRELIAGYRCLPELYK